MTLKSRRLHPTWGRQETNTTPFKGHLKDGKEARIALSCILGGWNIRLCSMSGFVICGVESLDFTNRELVTSSVYQLLKFLCQK
jgi:hypothetical protein